jgi:hypothetical protein
MRILWLVCKSCGASFESGVPLCRELLEGVKLRSLEVCPSCGVRADYEAADYREPDGVPSDRSGQDTSAATGPAAPGAAAAGDVPLAASAPLTGPAARA